MSGSSGFVEDVEPIPKGIGQGFEAMLWMRKGFGFAGAWTVREQNQLLAHCFGLTVANPARKDER